MKLKTSRRSILNHLRYKFFIWNSKRRICSKERGQSPNMVDSREHRLMPLIKIFTLLSSKLVNKNMRRRDLSISCKLSGPTSKSLSKIKPSLLRRKKQREILSISITTKVNGSSAAA
jgi:hypothetical protein